MADDTGGRRSGRRGPDPVALVGGLVALGVAGSGLTGTGPVWGPALPWALAGIAVLAGVALLVASLRNSRRPTDD